MRQKCHEGESKCGFATIDFPKACDSITTLYGTPSKLVVSNKTKKAIVLTDKESDMFEIYEYKQGLTSKIVPSSISSSLIRH